MIVGSERIGSRSPARSEATPTDGSRPQDAFARALHQKGFAPAGRGTGDESGASDGTTVDGGSPAGTPAGPIAAPASAPRPAGAAGVESIVTCAGAGAASACATGAAPMFVAAADGADASAWEASVRDGDGGALGLRAEPAPPGPGASAGWSITVISPALPAEVLARHAPGLTDRLRRRGIDARVRADGARHAAVEST